MIDPTSVFEFYNTISDIEDESISDESMDNEIDNIYEPEETSLTINNIIVTLPCNNKLPYYLVYMRLKVLDVSLIYKVRQLHSLLKLNIGKCIYLPTGECIAIIKTIWIKLIQRTWKNVLKKRQTHNNPCVTLKGMLFPLKRSS